MAEFSDKNKALVDRFVREVFNPQAWDSLGDIVATDVELTTTVSTESVRGHSGVSQYYQTLFQGAPDRFATVESLVAQEDKVALRWTLRGTHTGAFGGFPATQNRFEVIELKTFRVEDGRLREIWYASNPESILRQLGLLPDGPPPRAVRALLSLDARLRRRVS